MNYIDLPADRQSEIRKAWGELLSEYEWDVFATLTFKHARRDMFQVAKAARIWLKKWCRAEAEIQELVSVRKVAEVDHQRGGKMHRVKCFGPWWRKWKQGIAKPVYVMGIEKFHGSDDLHLHMIIRFSDYLRDMYRKRGWKIWYSEMKCGMARIEPPKDQADVRHYVSKYVIKDGEVFMSENFDTRYSCTTPLLQNA